MLTLYGFPMSNADRSHWMLVETAQPYEFKAVDLREASERERFQAINPDGKIPYLIDGDFHLAESLAINFYLAEKYAPQFWAEDVHQKAEIYQWSLFAMTNLFSEALTVLKHTLMLPEDKRDPAAVEQGKQGCARYVASLERALTGKDYLVDNRFTVADINVGSVVDLVAKTQAADCGPALTAWLERLRERPAYQKVFNT